MVEQFQSHQVRIVSKIILIHLFRKSFLFFTLVITAQQEKSCLPNRFAVFYMVTEEVHSPTAFVT